jgi:hydrogenase expression/formation protein HypD
MLKVPGSVSSLAQAKASGADVRVVYSPLGAVKLASENPRRKIIFLAVGFETTAPATAAAVLTAAGLGLKNFFLLSAHKRISPALKGLLQLAGTQLDGLLLPGHVCMITGLEPFAFLPDEYHRPAVVTGFASLDILLSVCMLLRQATGRPKLENAYPAAVRSEGNQVALRMLADVFEPSDQVWRGLGLIPRSGLALREALRLFDAEHSLPVAVAESAEPDGCRCGDVICGFIEPPACPRFGRSCSPPNPVGACMVSSEGACAAWYKYTHGRWLA